MDEVKYIPGDLVMFKIPFEPSIMGVGIVKFLGNISDVILLYPYTDLNLEYFIKVENVQGIPLTPEILEKNGWKKRGYGFYIKDNFPFLIRKEVDAFNVKIDTFDEDAFLKLSFVHQLQHLLFGLGLDSNLKV